MNDNAKVFSLIEMREMMIDTSDYQMMEEVGEFTGILEMKAQDKENLPTSETITIFTPEEIKIFKDEAFSTFSNGNFTRPVNFRKRYYRILKAAGIETKGLHSLRHTFATNLVNGIKQADGTIKSLTPRQVADLLGHTTSEITELYYVKRDLTKLNRITDGFEL